MVDERHISGLSELYKFLEKFPKQMVPITRGGLRAGGVKYKDEAKMLCPVAEPSDTNKRLYGGYAGALRDTIRVSTEAKGKNVYARVKAGGNTKKGAKVWYAHLIEFTGAAPHMNRGVMHPGFVAVPFMRPAFDGKTNAAIVAVGNYIKNRLSTKQGLDTAYIEIEVEQ